MNRDENRILSINFSKDKPEGQKAGPKLEVGAHRAFRLLVIYNLLQRWLKTQFTLFCSSGMNVVFALDSMAIQLLEYGIPPRFARPRPRLLLLLLHFSNIL